MRTVTPARLIAQVVLATAAIALFAWLINVLLNHPDAGTDGLAQGTWVATLLILLALVLLIMVLMSDLVLDRIRGVGRVRTAPEEDSMVIGCPACGTVFSKPLAELADDASFQCDNCGREGFIRDHSLNRKTIRNEHCTTCGHVYQEYREFSECPVCHTYNEY